MTPTPARTSLFVPGLGARGRAYRRGLGPDWAVLELPPLHRHGGSLVTLRDWLVDELRRRPAPARVAGHSLGAALAVAAAAAAPELIDELVLLAPAGLPLVKPVHASLADLGRQLLRREHDPRDLVATALDAARAPRAAMRLVRAARRLDLSATMPVVRGAGVSVTVIGCPTDTLVPPSLARRVAAALQGSYREVDTDAGHVWPISRPALLRQSLASLA